MGMFMSFMGGGSVYSQVLNFVSGTVYNQFVEKNIQTPEDFQMAILDIFNTLNAALPGKHYDVPPRDDVENFFKKWENACEQERKKIFVKFMTENVKLNKIDHMTMITGIVTPPAAMAAKRAGETVPQLKMIKAVPDVIFVPFATVLALFSVKISRRVMGKIKS